MPDEAVSISSPGESTSSLARGASGEGYARDAAQHRQAFDDAAVHHDEHEHHGPSSLLLYAVFFLLLILTAVTVGVTAWDFGYNLNLIVAMLIATVKAAVVGLWFMHLRWDPPIFGFVLIASLGFVTLFIVFTLLDTGEYTPNIEQQTVIEASQG